MMLTTAEGILTKCPWHNPDCFTISLATGGHLKCHFPSSFMTRVHELKDQGVRVSGFVTEKRGYLHEQRIDVQQLEVLYQDSNAD
jgi:hypothetical protein